MNLLPQNIIDEWGLGSYDPAQQVELVNQLGNLMYQAILVRALDILSEKEQIEFDELLDKDTTTPQEIITFLSSKIPTFDLLVIEERNKLKQNLLIPVA